MCPQQNNLFFKIHNVYVSKNSLIYQFRKNRILKFCGIACPQNMHTYNIKLCVEFNSCGANFNSCTENMVDSSPLIFIKMLVQLVQYTGSWQKKILTTSTENRFFIYRECISQNHFLFFNFDTEVFFSGTKFIAWMQKHQGNVQRMPRQKKKNNTFISDAVLSFGCISLSENHQIPIHKPWMDGQEEKSV